MPTVFSVRGNSTTARYAGGKAEATLVGATPPVVAPNASAIGGSAIQFRPGSMSFLSWPAHKNLFDGRAFWIHMGIIPQYTGVPASSQSFWTIGYTNWDGGAQNYDAFHTGGSGGMYIYGHNELAANSFNTNGNVWSPVSGTKYDLVWKWDGTTTANSYKLYINGVLHDQLTPFSALSAALTSGDWPAILLGCTFNNKFSNFDLYEFNIGSGDIDPTNVTLESGAGSLNGSRTSFMSVSAFSGSTYTDPGIANVKTGTAYTQAGVSLTGTYTGSDRWSDPGVIYVLEGTQYKANSLTNNRTGTLVTLQADAPSTDMFKNLESLVLKTTTKTLGITVSYTRLGQLAETIKGVFDNAYVEVQGVTSIKPVLQIRLADLTGEPNKGDTVLINAINYRVLESRKDGFGGSTLILQKV